VRLIARAETAATLAGLLVLTTPWTHVLKALRILRVPALLVIVLGMTYRYIFLLLRLAEDFFEARRSRLIRPLSRPDQRRMAGAAAGVLLSKSLQLSEEVYLAMQSRGFRGSAYTMDDFRFRGRDWLAEPVSASPPRSRSGRVSVDFPTPRCQLPLRGSQALSNVSLSIQEGQRVVLLGANGSGKSTLLRLLDGLCFPGSGSVLFRGRELSEASLMEEDFAFQFRRAVALVFQNPDVQLFNPTVFDEIAFAPCRCKCPAKNSAPRWTECLSNSASPL